MEIQFKIVGALLILLAIMHAGFPKQFNWKKELSALSLINKEMMVIHTFFIALTVLLMGALCLFESHELVTSPFGKKISLGFGIFWACRLFIQFFGYSSELWKGKRFETIVHVLFSILWSYLTALFLIAYFS